MTTLAVNGSVRNPECTHCGEEHEPVRTLAECELTRARLVQGNWLIIEQAVAVARERIAAADKNVAALALYEPEADLSEDLEQFKAAWKDAQSATLVVDAFIALLVRATSREVEHSEARLREERRRLAERNGDAS
jgi:hypothetical protein